MYFIITITSYYLHYSWFLKTPYKSKYFLSICTNKPRCGGRQNSFPHTNSTYLHPAFVIYVKTHTCCRTFCCRHVSSRFPSTYGSALVITNILHYTCFCSVYITMIIVLCVYSYAASWFPYFAVFSLPLCNQRVGSAFLFSTILFSLYKISFISVLGVNHVFGLCE